MSERLLRWFGDHRNEMVLEMVSQHLGLTQSAVEGLYNMVSECDSLAKKQEYYEKISEMEMKADEIRKEMVTELSLRNIFPDEREDLMELVRAVDWVADWAREAGRIMVIIPFEGASEDIREAVVNMSKANRDCVIILANCIRELSRDPRKALDLADQVELIEEDIDDLYTKARMIMSKTSFVGFTRGAIILFNEFLDAIETIADWCENTADIVRAIAIRVI